MSSSQIKQQTSHGCHTTPVLGKWSCPARDIIDKLVKFLKEKNRWTREGRALRQLNKHWCFHLSQFVTEICPDESRSVGDEELQSLLKFPQLTSLDVLAFSWTKAMDRLAPSDIVNVLTQMPKLSHLKVDTYFTRMLTAEDVRRLQGITSVDVEFDFDASRKQKEKGLVKLADLPLKNLKICRIVDSLKKILPAMKNLKSLDAFVKDVSSSDAAALMKLDEVTLRMNGSLSSFISEVTSIVSLDLADCTTETVDSLVNLSNLRCLTLRIIERGVVVSQSFQLIVGRLTSLCLECWMRPINLPAEFVAEAPRLKTLNLMGFDLNDGRRLGQSLQSLSNLILWMCIGFESLMSGITGSTSISVTTTAAEWKKNVSFCPDESQMIPQYHQIKSLEILSFDSDIDKICHLQQLEVLKLHFMQSDIEILECLSHLSNLSALTITGLTVLQVDRLLKMSTLTKLEKLKIETRTSSVNGGDILDPAIEAFKQKAPNTDFLISINIMP